MNNPKKIIIIAVVIVLFTVAISLIFNGLTKKYSDVISFCNPVFSSTDDRAAYCKYCLKENSDQEVIDAKYVELCLIDFKTKEKKILCKIELVRNKGFRLVSFSGDELIYEKSDYTSAVTEIYKYNVNTNEESFMEVRRKAPPLTYTSTLNSENRVQISPVQQERMELKYISGSKESVSVMSTLSKDEYFHSIKWSPKGFFFQLRTYNAISFSDVLYFYDTDSENVVKLADNVTDYIASSKTDYVTALTPIKDKKSWEVTVFDTSSPDSALSNEIYKDDLFLYSWSTDGKGFLFQQNRLLKYYIPETEALRTVQNADSDGEWGKPLSPYFTIFSPTGSKLAILSRTLANDGIIERLTVVDMISQQRHDLYEKKIADKNTRTSFLPDFYPHISWDREEKYIIFESSNVKNPSIKRLCVLRPDGKKFHQI